MIKLFSICDVCNRDLKNGLNGVELEDSIICETCYIDSIIYCTYCKRVKKEMDYITYDDAHCVIYKAICPTCENLLSLYNIKITCYLGDDIVL